MKHINKFLITQLRRHSVEMEILLAIQEVPWENLKVDEPVYVADSFEAFCAGTATLAHFSKITHGKFEVFNGGKSSVTRTATSSGCYGYFLCLPKTIYEEINKYAV